MDAQEKSGFNLFGSSKQLVPLAVYLLPRNLSRFQKD
jgi:hypothetical protein